MSLNLMGGQEPEEKFEWDSPETEGGESKKSGILEPERGENIKREEDLKWKVGNSNKKTEMYIVFLFTLAQYSFQDVITELKALGIYPVGLAHWKTVF